MGKSWNGKKSSNFESKQQRYIYNTESNVNASNVQDNNNDKNKSAETYQQYINTPRHTLYIDAERERERGGITGRRLREPPGGGSRGGGAAGVNGGEDIHEGEQNSDDDGGVDRQKQRLGVSYLLQPTLPAHFLFLLPTGFSQIPQILATI